ncbi:MAG: GTPase ObgE [Candidatus Omnitrophota bacterium]|nr:MAG: GTPase ObgE [Candidatus Omnitrophota bacterium]
MFVDRVKIYVKAGNGGKGCESFYYRKGFRHRRADGGDGGDGGNIIITTNLNVPTLLGLRFNQHFKAQTGVHGSSNLKKGKRGKDCLISVPVGTNVFDLTTGCLIRDLSSEDEQVIVVKGGLGGIGNYKKQQATLGQVGEEKLISLELKLIADVGLIGYPNAGKSSFVNIVSNAKPKVAQFPFTTLSPVLGTVEFHCLEQRFVIADIPGIIENAHKGKGLGLAFLRHIERTKVSLFFIDMAGTCGREPLTDYSNLLKEIKLYNPQLLKKARILAANKMDIPLAKHNLKEFRKNIKEDIFPVSCNTGQGIEELKTFLLEQVNQIREHTVENEPKKP